MPVFVNMLIASSTAAESADAQSEAILIGLVLSIGCVNQCM
jgi:hypothetical protein